MTNRNKIIPSDAMKLVDDQSTRLANTRADNKYQALIPTLLPPWFVKAPPSVRDALRESMQRRDDTYKEVSRILASVTPMVQFVETRLKNALIAQGWYSVDVKRYGLKHVHLPSNVLAFISRQNINVADSFIRLLFPSSWVPESLEVNVGATTTYQSLLQAAMQNFELSETQAEGFDPGTSIYSVNNNQPTVHTELAPEQFARVCRDLNAGLQYQLHLDSVFTPVENAWPATDPRAQAYKIKTTFSDHLRHEFSCALHMAYMKGEISVNSYNFGSRVLMGPASTLGLGNPAYGVFEIMDVEVTGIMVLWPQRKPAAQAQPCLVYLPQSPDKSFYAFETFSTFQVHLREWLKRQEFADYFAQRVPLSQRAEFIRRTHPQHASWDSLLLRRPPIIYEPALFTESRVTPRTDDPFDVMWLQQLKRIKDDARILIVPTEDQDTRERLERQAIYLNLGISALGLALGFVPVLGEVLLAVGVIQLGEEVYAGIKAWEAGDKVAAINYLFDIAQNVALLAGPVAASKTLKAPGVVDALVPVKLESGARKLWNPQMAPYAVEGVDLGGIKPDVQGIYTRNGQSYIKLDDKVYSLHTEAATQAFSVRHPTDPMAYRPQLKHNGMGVWTHELDRPLEWTRLQLFRRLGPDAQALSASAVDRLLAATNTSDAVLCKVLIDNLSTPSLLADGLKRMALIERIEAFITRMQSAHTGHASDADIQLNVLPQLPGWPADRVLRVISDDGQAYKEYGKDLVSRLPRLQVTESQVAQGDLLNVTLECLSPDQIEGLLGQKLSSLELQVQRLAQHLGEFTQTQKKEVFSSLYLEGETLGSAGSIVKRQFPSLSAVVITELLEHLTAEQVSLLEREERLPMTVLEEARSLVQTLRLNRALEGLFNDALSSEDSSALGWKSLPWLPGWPRELRVVIRDKATGLELDSAGSATARRVRELFKSAQGYEYFATSSADSYSSRSLLQCVLTLLSANERSEMGLSTQEPYASFTAKIARVATEARDRSAQALGMHTLKPWFKSPMRLADGRVGYTLGGRSGHTLPDVQPQLLKHAVLELYPLMNDEQAGQFLHRLKLPAAQIARALGALKAELETLRHELHAWENSTVWSHPLNAPRFKVTAQVKRSISQVLIRAWRRLTPSAHIGGHIGYELDLNAWPVDCLPVLSADFAHINVLRLSQSPGGAFPAHFLDKFHQLRILSLKQNKLVELPGSIGEMSELLDLDLRGNQLVLTPEAARTLAGLTKLKSLNLTGNPLGSRLMISQMRALEYLYVRYTGLTQWPEGIEMLEHLNIVDLRDNAISHVPSQVLTAERNVINRVTFLHDNPLSNDSLRRLYLYQREQGINFGISIPRHHVMPRQGIAHWAVAPSAAQLAAWEDLNSAEYASDFFRVLEDLSESSQFLHERENLRLRVWALVNAMHENSGLRSRVFEVSTHPRTCSDGIAMVFADIELQQQIYMAEHQPQTEQQLLKLARGLFRIEQLNEHVESVIALRKAQVRARALEAVEQLQQLSDAISPDFSAGPVSEMTPQDRQGVAYRLGSPEGLALAERLSPVWLENHLAQIDPLEIQMYYHIRLAETLNLPNRPESMRFVNVANVTQEELDAGEAYVMAQETSAALTASIVARDFWTAFLEKKYPESFKASDIPHQQYMDRLFTARESVSSDEYASQAESIAGAHSQSRVALATRLTRQEIQEHPELMFPAMP